jgi:hypothetical protein
MVFVRRVLSAATRELWIVPLTEAVSFKVRLQRGNRVQVPRPIRWRFKLETSQVLRVNVTLVDARTC